VRAVRRQQLGEALVEPAQVPVGNGDPDEHGQHALGHRPDVGGLVRCTVAVVSDDRRAVHAHEHRTHVGQTGRIGVVEVGVDAAFERHEVLRRHRGAW
jgi:hypothetical protein